MREMFSSLQEISNGAMGNELKCYMAGYIEQQLYCIPSCSLLFKVRDDTSMLVLPVHPHRHHSYKCLSDEGKANMAMMYLIVFQKRFGFGFLGDFDVELGKIIQSDCLEEKCFSFWLQYYFGICSHKILLMY